MRHTSSARRADVRSPGQRSTLSVSDVTQADAAVDTVPERDLALDAARAAGIVLVVLGHALIRSLDVVPAGTPGGVLLSGIGTVRMTPLAGWVLTIIYSFHMPLLAFVSGHAFARSSSGYGTRFIGRRAAGLLVPYFAWLSIAWLLTGDLRPAGLLSFAWSAVIDPQSPGALWFLYALFGSAVVLALAMRMGGSDRLLLVSALIVGAAGVLPLGAYSNVLGLSDIAWLYPFVVAGVLGARHRRTLDAAGYLRPVALLVWAASLPLVWPVLVSGPRWWTAGVVAILDGLGPIAPIVAKALWAAVRVVGALAGTYVVFTLAARVRGAALGAAAWLGRRTLGVYATHSHILLHLAPVLSGLASFTRAALLFAAALTAALLITLALEATWVTRRLLLGQRS